MQAVFTYILGTNATKFVEMGAYQGVFDAMFFFPQHVNILNEGAHCLAALTSESRSFLTWHTIYF